MLLFLCILLTLGSCVETVYNTSITPSGFFVKWSTDHVRLYHFENPDEDLPLNVDNFVRLEYATVVQYSNGSEKELFFVAYSRENKNHLIHVYNLDEIALTIEYKMSFNNFEIPHDNFIIYSILMPLKDTLFVTCKLTDFCLPDTVCVAKLSLCNGGWRSCYS